MDLDEESQNIQAIQESKTLQFPSSLIESPGILQHPAFAIEEKRSRMTTQKRCVLTEGAGRTLWKGQSPL